MNEPTASGRDETKERKDKSTGLPNDPQKFHLRIDSGTSLPLGSEKLTCAIAARCGGCPQFELTSTAQREVKSNALLAGLRARGVEYSAGIAWLGGRTMGYRNRIRLAVRSGLPSYFNDDKDPACAVLEPPVLSVVAAFEGWAPSHRSALSNYCVAEVRTPDADGRAAIYLRHTQRNGMSVPAPDWTLLPDAFESVLLAVEGGPLRFQRYLVTDELYAKIPVGGFMQVNASANRLMVEQVVAWAARVGAGRVLDLFAGSGNFTLPLTHAGAEVRAVESDVSACQALAMAAREQAFERVTVDAADALHRASELADAGETYDLIIADPPRGGLRGNVDALCALTKAAIVLVSCDAQRFCDDARALCDRGFHLTECTPVDMFPHTRHMEVLGLFVKT